MRKKGRWKDEYEEEWSKRRRRRKLKSWEGKRKKGNERMKNRELILERNERGRL